MYSQYHMESLTLTTPVGTHLFSKFIFGFLRKRKVEIILEVQEKGSTSKEFSGRPNSPQLSQSNSSFPII